MNPTRLIFICGVFAAALVTAIACGPPSGDPKTAPNSPMPVIDKKDTDGTKDPDTKKPSPPPLLGDAG